MGITKLNITSTRNRILNAARDIENARRNVHRENRAT